MESPALMSGSLECGDGSCKVMSNNEQLPFAEAEPSAANQCNFSSSLESGLGQSATWRSSQKAELGNRDYSVYKAADLLYTFHLNEIVTAQQCTNGCEDHKDNKCKDICSCAVAAPEVVATECCNSACCPCTDNAVIPNETNVNRDTDIFESDNVFSTENDLKTDKTENVAILPHPTSDVVAATTRCRHATTDSSSSVHDCVASGHDVVFSGGIEYRPYGCERHLRDIMELVSRDLSEPYSIYTYRYFIYNWPNLCFRVSSVILCIWTSRTCDLYIELTV